jgi:hypothetical protein
MVTAGSVTMPTVPFYPTFGGGSYILLRPFFASQRGAQQRILDGVRGVPACFHRLKASAAPPAC